MCLCNRHVFFTRNQIQQQAHLTGLGFAYHGVKQFVIIAGNFIARRPVKTWGRVTHICVNKLSSLVQIMACRLAGAKPLSEPMPECYYYWTFGNKLQWIYNRNLYILIQEIHLKMSPGKWRPSCLGLMCYVGVHLFRWPNAKFSEWQVRKWGHRAMLVYLRNSEN